MSYNRGEYLIYLACTEQDSRRTKIKKYNAKIIARLKDAKVNQY